MPFRSTASVERYVKPAFLLVSLRKDGYREIVRSSRDLLGLLRAAVALRGKYHRRYWIESNDLSALKPTF